MYCWLRLVGAGKSTLIKFIIAALDIPLEDVAYVAYTGKAAQVLRSKGCPNATTAHRLLYTSFPRPDGTFIHVPKQVLDRAYKIIVVDEVSMLPLEMWELLLSHGVYVLACGDPGQLPAIALNHDILEQPHVFLDEIMRQAKDSEIIRLSADIRAGRPIKPYKGTEINVVKHSDMVDGMFRWADQIICGKNATRRGINNYCRRMIWGDGVDLSLPLVGDKVICLKNNWDRVTEAGDALVNGITGAIDYINVCGNKWLKKKCTIDFTPEGLEECDKDQSFRKLLIDWKFITTGEPTVNEDNFRRFPRWLRPELFDYGYCITCWKAQGSEYDKVLFFAERVRTMDREMYLRYLYTGCTRARTRLTLILKE